jgi:Aspartyl/Asparaginyl beta-hydroxylase
MAIMQNFKKLISNINVNPLLDQLQNNPHLWNESDLWTRGKEGSAIYNTDNIILRFNKSPGWDKEAFTILSAAQEIVFNLMHVIPGEHLGKVVITKLRSGEIIADHIDMMPPGVPPYFQRYQIPLSVSPGVIFKCGDEEVYMKPGEAWWFDNQVTHSVTNNSNEDRISMLADIRPFIPLKFPRSLSG